MYGDHSDTIACVAIAKPAPTSRPPATRPVIDGDVEVRLDRRPWAERDRVLIFVWSGEAPLIDVLTKQRRTSLWGRWFLRDAKGGLIGAEVCYADQVVVRAEIAESGGVARFALTHSGGHQDAAAFSLRHDSTPSDKGQSPIVRAVIVLATRPETDMELLARRLLQEPDDQLEPYPGMTELLALKRALSG